MRQQDRDTAALIAALVDMDPERREDFMQLWRKLSGVSECSCGT